MTAKKVDEETQEALIAALTEDHRSASVSGADHALLDYAAKLTRQPAEMKREDVEALRGKGFDDRGIHDLCAIVGYFAFVNRIADGLGVELEGT